MKKKKCFQKFGRIFLVFSSDDNFCLLVKISSEESQLNEKNCWSASVWTHLTKFCHFGKIVKVFTILRCFSAYRSKFRKYFCRLFGQIFCAVNGQILKKYSSHLVTLVSVNTLHLPKLKLESCSNLKKQCLKKRPRALTQ